MRALALVVVLVVASCGEGVVGSGGGSGATEYEGTGMVLEDRTHGPELCLGGSVMASDPVQCRGLKLVGWSWDAVEGEDSRLGTTTIGAHVRGRLEGDVFTLTAPPGPGRRTVTLDTEPFDGSPACARPSGDTSADWRTWEGTGATAHPEVVAAWVTDPAGPEDGPFTGNVWVRPGAAAAVTAIIRERYAGPLCVAERDLPTMHELARVQDRLMEVVGQMVWMSYPDNRGGAVRALVTYVDDAVRARVDREFGRGRVDLVGALTPIT